MDFDNRKVYGDTSITDGLVLIRTDSNIRTVWNSKYILTDIYQNKVVISDAFQQNQMNSWI